MAVHPTGEVGLVGSAELPQPNSIAANPTHSGIRINIRNLPLLEDRSAEWPTQMPIPEWICPLTSGERYLLARVDATRWLRSGLSLSAHPDAASDRLRTLRHDDAPIVHG